MASANVLEFTPANWQKEVIESEQPVVVDFWAPWCGPCRALAPTIDKIAAQFAGKVKVGKFNVDDGQEIASEYQITTIPRILIFKGGREPRETIARLVSEAELTKSINKVLEG